MNKVKLLLEELRVESFETNPDLLRLGTVWGLQEESDSGVHSECETHCIGCPTEPFESVVHTHCNANCPSWNGQCNTANGNTCVATCPGAC